MTRLVRGTSGLVQLVDEAGDAVATILDMDLSNDRERLLVAAITVARLASGGMEVDQIRIAQVMATKLTLAFIAGADAEEKKRELPS
jgi:hypothetical protein